VTGTSLVGLRVLVIEDESLITMLFEDTLADIGCIIAAKASRLPEAIEKASNCLFDLAILDLNLDGQDTVVVAEVLTKRKIPFFFATGYGRGVIPERFTRVPVLNKPFQDSELVLVLQATLAQKIT
jgi:CheY-like chemotaxis protein